MRNGLHLVYFAPVPWRSYAQRPHAMARYFLERGGRSVLWIDPYPTRLPRWSDIRPVRDLHDQGTELPETISVLSPRAIPVEPLPGGAWINRRLGWRETWNSLMAFARGKECVIGVGRPSALAIDALRALPARSSFYDAMDDFPAFYRGLSRLSMRRREREVARLCSQIYVSSASLAEKFQRIGQTAIRMPNACDPGSLPEPERNGGLVFGYIGTMASWFDWDFVIRLARAFRAAEVRLIGPRFHPAPPDLPSNVLLSPPCRHAEAGRRLADFAVGLIPFRKCALTQSVDPIKYYEYRAMGLPVLSSTFGDMASRGSQCGVYFYDRGATVESVVGAALKHVDTAEAINRFRAQNSWDARFRDAGLFDA